MVGKGVKLFITAYRLYTGKKNYGNYLRKTFYFCIIRYPIYNKILILQRKQFWKLFGGKYYIFIIIRL